MADSVAHGLFDFSNHEDLFFCVDALTRAVAALAQHDPDLAGELTRITNSFLAMAERASAPAKTAVAAVEPVDLLNEESGGVGPSAPDTGAIIDVLTGERI